MTFAAVATEVSTGHEIWLSKGELVPAMRASYALPGIFEPVRIGGRWLFDGAIVNPVPVNVARAFGADRVIAIAIGGDTGSGGTAILDPASAEEPAKIEPPPEREPNGLGGWRRRALWVRRAWAQDVSHAPGLAAVMVNTINIT